MWTLWTVLAVVGFIGGLIAGTIVQFSFVVLCSQDYPTQVEDARAAGLTALGICAAIPVIVSTVATLLIRPRRWAVLVIIVGVEIMVGVPAPHLHHRSKRGIPTRFACETKTVAGQPVPVTPAFDVLPRAATTPHCNCSNAALSCFAPRGADTPKWENLTPHQHRAN